MLLLFLVLSVKKGFIFFQKRLFSVTLRLLQSRVWILSKDLKISLLFVIGAIFYISFLIF